MYLNCKLDSDTVEESQVKTKNEDKKEILCSFCNHPVTDFDMQISVNHSHQHIFANPHGLVFEIGCYKNAKGCKTVSSFSTEFTWFPGYAWKIAVCNSCSSHLGWRFISSDHSFYGLILEKLVIP